MYAPGATAKSALLTTKNPALKRRRKYLGLNPNFAWFVQVGLRFRRSVLVHMSRKLRSSQKITFSSQFTDDENVILFRLDEGDSEAYIST